MNMIRTRATQTGSMILEALISILIFSIGILALVGMQATAVNNAGDAKYRSSAGFLANEMVGAVWAARQINPLAQASNVSAFIPDPSFACSNCSASGVGNSTTNSWANNVAKALPIATTSITITAGTIVTITIGWQAPNDAVAHRHAVQTFIN